MLLLCSFFVVVLCLVYLILHVFVVISVDIVSLLSFRFPLFSFCVSLLLLCYFFNVSVVVICVSLWSFCLSVVFFLSLCCCSAPFFAVTLYVFCLHVGCFAHVLVVMCLSVSHFVSFPFHFLSVCGVLRPILHLSPVILPPLSLLMCLLVVSPCPFQLHLTGEARRPLGLCPVGLFSNPSVRAQGQGDWRVL